MTYYIKDKKAFIRNGPGVVRVLQSEEIQDPYHFDRVVKILVVQEVKKASPTNPVKVGERICLSFPKSNLNPQEYTWGRNGYAEPCQVYLKLETAGA